MPTRRIPDVRAVVPAVTRAIAILRLLGRSRTPHGRQGDRPDARSGAQHGLHILRALVAEELGEGRSADQALQPGRRHAAAGARRDREQRLSEPGAAGARRPLEAATASRRSASRSPACDHMVVVALSRSQIPFRLHVDVGSRFPALISATGRCVAAFSGQPLKRDRKAISLAALAERAELRRLAQGGRSGTPQGLQHRPRQLHQRRHDRGGAGAEQRAVRSRTRLPPSASAASSIVQARWRWHAICALLRKRSPRSSSPQLTPEVSALAASVAQEGSERHRKR